MQQDDGSIWLKPGQGTTVSPPGHPVITTKVSGDDVSGAFAMLEMTVYREGPPRHIHRGEEETFYVLEGEVTLQLGDQEIQGVPGSVVLVPRGTPHTFWNVKPEPAKLLVIFSPAGYEGFFVEVAGLEGEVGSAQYLAEVGAIREQYNAELAR